MVVKSTKIAAISPDSRYLAASGGGGAFVVEISTGEVIQRLEQSGKEADGWVGGIWDANFSPDGELLALATGDFGARMTQEAGPPGAVILWRWRQNEVYRVLKARRYPLFGAVFTPDGWRILAAKINGKLLVYDSTPAKHVQIDP